MPDSHPTWWARSIPSGLIWGFRSNALCSSPFEPFIDWTHWKRSSLNTSCPSSDRSLAIFVLSNTLAALRGIFFWKEARSRTLIARLTGGRNMSTGILDAVLILDYLNSAIPEVMPILAIYYMNILAEIHLYSTLGSLSHEL